MAPGEQDDCYALRTPVNLVESPQEVSAAVLSVVVW
jgi:hypothetical protein